MKRVAVIQPYLLPYLPYYQLIHVVDELWILDDVQYIRRGWMNRNYLLVDGRRSLFTLPVSRGKQCDLIKEKRLANGFATELSRLARRLDHAYARAPYRAAAGKILSHLQDRGWSLFLDVALSSLRLTCDGLGISTPMFLTSSLGLPEHLRGTQRILQVCKVASADHYINPIGGIGLYDGKEFLSNGIRLSFLRGRFLPYNQGGHRPFEAGLSILDLMSWVPPADFPEHLAQLDLLDPESRRSPPPFSGSEMAEVRSRKEMEIPCQH